MLPEKWPLVQESAADGEEAQWRLLREETQQLEAEMAAPPVEARFEAQRLEFDMPATFFGHFGADRS